MATLMNEKWWVANKAKTLTDAGDTVKKALAEWDKQKKTRGQSLNATKVKTALKGVKDASEALRKKANSVIHKATCGVLDTYVKNCNAWTKQLDAADGKQMLAWFIAGNVPAPMIASIKSMYAGIAQELQETAQFLNTMKAKKGSKWIFDTYIKAGAPRQVNINSQLLGEITTAVAGSKWTDPSWEAAFIEIKKEWGNNARAKGAECAVIEKANVLEVVENQ